LTRKTTGVETSPVLLPESWRDFDDLRKQSSEWKYWVPSVVKRAMSFEDRRIAFELRRFGQWTSSTYRNAVGAVVHSDMIEYTYEGWDQMGKCAVEPSMLGLVV